MIRVTIEMVPYGLEDQKRELGVMEIANVGGDSVFGKYEWTAREGELGARGRIYSFERSRGFWALVRLCFEDLRRTRLYEMPFAGRAKRDVSAD